MRNWKNFLGTFCILWIAQQASAQWEVSASAGIAAPITGYEQVFKTGSIINAEGKYRFRKRNFALGLETHFVRLQKDKNPSDAFQNARMTIVPLLLNGTFEIDVHNRWKPYLYGGLGVSVFSLHYDVGPMQGYSYTNTSFTMSPKVGLRYEAADQLIPFIQMSMVFIADGPPQGFPKAGKAAGYNTATIGISYRFN